MAGGFRDCHGHHPHNHRWRGRHRHRDDQPERRPARQGLCRGATGAVITMAAPLVLAVTYTGLHDRLKVAGYEPIAWPTNDAAWRQVESRAPEVVAVITIGPWPLTAAFMAAAGKLRLICCLGAGYDNYDPAMLAGRGVRLVNSAGVNAHDVAELAFGLFIAAQRQIVAADKWVREGAWPQRPAYTHRIHGTRLGVLGLGHIGHAVAALGVAFGMAIGWH